MWNPLQIEEMKLPPCHFSFQFYVDEADNININVFMRSCDLFCGFPYDIALYSALLIAVGKYTSFAPKYVQINITDCHIYEEHIPGVKQYLKNKKHKLPTLLFEGDLFNMEPANFELVNYKCEEYIKINVEK